MWLRIYGLLVARAYRPQRGRGHVTAIHDSVPSNIQIRQWFVVTAVVWIALLLWADNVDFTIKFFSL